jgi:hypothetical protein
MICCTVQTAGQVRTTSVQCTEAGMNSHITVQSKLCALQSQNVHEGAGLLLDFLCLFFKKYDFPVIKYDFPVVKYDFPTVKYDFPVEKYDFPVEKYHFPTQKYNFPTQKYDFPVENTIFLWENVIFLLSQ